LSYGRNAFIGGNSPDSRIHSEVLHYRRWCKNEVMGFAGHPGNQQCNRAVLLSSGCSCFIQQSARKKDAGKGGDSFRAVFFLVGWSSACGVISVIILTWHLARADCAIDINADKFFNIEFGGKRMLLKEQTTEGICVV